MNITEVHFLYSWEFHVSKSVILEEKDAHLLKTLPNSMHKQNISVECASWHVAVMV